MFGYRDTKQLQDAGYVRSLDGSYEIEADEFGYSGIAKIKASSKEIKGICFTAVLSETELTDAAAARKVTEDFVTAFSEEYGFAKLDMPVGVQFCDNETLKSCPADSFEAMASGYLLLEYSYRDADGVLWIAQVYSPSDSVIQGSLTKQIEESGYENFEPGVAVEKGEV